MLDETSNLFFMRQWIVAPPDASDADLASFIAPYLLVETIRREHSVVAVWWSGDNGLTGIRRRIDAWEAKRALPGGRESLS